MGAMTPRRAARLFLVAHLLCAGAAGAAPPDAGAPPVATDPEGAEASAYRVIAQRLVAGMR